MNGGSSSNRRFPPTRRVIRRFWLIHTLSPSPTVKFLWFSLQSTLLIWNELRNEKRGLQKNGIPKKSHLSTGPQLGVKNFKNPQFLKTFSGIDDHSEERAIETFPHRPAAPILRARNNPVPLRRCRRLNPRSSTRAPHCWRGFQGHTSPRSSRVAHGIRRGSPRARCKG